MSEWRSMQTAPRDGTVIIGCINGSEVRIQWCPSVARWLDLDVTHPRVDRICKYEPFGWRPIAHVSPNRAEPGSVVHDAEAWLLSQGLTIPHKGKHPHLFQGMLDDYSERARQRRGKQLMARSTYIYMIRRIKCQSILGAATVKYEAHQLVDRSGGAIPRDSVELVRYRDGRIDDGVVIPWEWE